MPLDGWRHGLARSLWPSCCGRVFSPYLMAEETIAGMVQMSPLPDRLKDARRELYREHILQAAEVEFSQSGFTSVKVADIARRAGVSLTTVYKNFGGKEDLWDELYAERMKEFTSAIKQRTQGLSSPFETILVAARAEVEFFAERESFLALHLSDGLSWGTGSSLPGAGRGGQRDAWLTGMGMLAEAAQAGIDAGEIIPMRPQIVASLVISALQVWLTDWVAAGRDRPIDLVADEVVEHLHRSLARLR